MTVRRFWVRGYRSVVKADLELSPVTVVVGANGTGKTNLYRALRLMSLGARGELATTLLGEGGMPSVMYAGERPRRKGEPARVVVGVTVDEVSYELALGVPSDTGRFCLDPEVKEEVVWVGAQRHPRSVVADRSGNSGVFVDVDGHKVAMAGAFDPAETALAQLREPARFPELFALRNHLARWRFYHEFPTGTDAPARRSQPGVRTPVLADDGHDLAAAVATICEIGRRDLLDDAVAGAFPGSRVRVDSDGGAFSLRFHQPGMARPTQSSELSDGTLRFLYLATALLTPRPPGLLVLNEPETGLHGPVLGPLASLMAEAARDAQLVVTTHSGDLADLLRSEGAEVLHTQRSGDGATEVDHVSRCH